MAYDERLADRLRQLFAGNGAFSERQMFGGVAFMLNGNMCVGVVDQKLMVRVGSKAYQEALAHTHARPMDFTGRPLKGMVYVEPAGIARQRSLNRWVKMAESFVQSLPAKRGAEKKPTAARGKQRTAPAGFGGFGPGTFRFLRGLSTNNDKRWFEAHREDYETHYLTPALAFTSELGPRLQRISKGVHFEPHVNGSLFRIQRDIRFSKDKSPYKPHIDLWFWHGDRKDWSTPGFFFRLAAKQLTLGAGVHKFGPGQLEAYRKAALASKQGSALTTLLCALRESGYEIGGESRKTVPRGYPSDHPRSRLLLHEGLFAMLELKPPKQVRSPALLDFCANHYAAFEPVCAWLLKTLT